jgi:ABC-type Fe3+/spermidine/putrescine transport system ATPase subunit
MQLELKSLQREVGISFVFVTHDQEEAMVMSDRIALLRSGALEQVATPREIYSRPATSYTAQFIGHTNLLRGRVEGGRARCGGLEFRTGAPEGPVIFSLRPEHIRLASSTPSGDVVCFNACVLTQSFHGATDLLQVECSEGLKLTVRLPSLGALSGQRDFEFCAGDAIPVRNSEEKY